MSFYANQHKMRDGNVLLYQRTDHVDPAWQMKLKIPGMKGQILKTTGTRCLAEAMEIASDLYDDLRIKVKNNIPVIELTFGQLWDKWFNLIGRHKKDARQKFIVSVGNRYILPYLSTTPLSQVNDIKLMEYWNWRLIYWTSGPGKERAERTRHFAKIPTPETLEQERILIRAVLLWGKAQKFICDVPAGKVPVPKRSRSDVARPAFTLEEFRKLYRSMQGENWIKAGGTHTNAYGRRMLRAFILIGMESGMRPREMLNLKWKDFEIFQDEAGVRKCGFNVCSTKTGRRFNGANLLCEVWIDNLRRHSRYTRPDDFIFTTIKGTQHKDFSKPFRHLMVQSGLLYDVHGDPRTPYSMRHTYITLKLLQGKVNVYDLAENLGTSLEMIRTHYDHVTGKQRAARVTD